MGSKRIVLSSNNLYLLPWSDKTVGVVDPGRDLNTHDVVPRDIDQGRQLGLVGNNARSTHRELEVFGVVISGKKLEDLSADLINHQCVANREGFMIMYFNIGAGDMYLKNPSSVIRRLNDLFDWSKYGVTVPVPAATAWDRFEVNTGKLMVDSKLGDGKKVEELTKLIEEKEKENQKLKEERKKEDDESISLEELLKEKDELIQQQNKDLEERDNELNAVNKVVKAKDKEISDLKSTGGGGSSSAAELQKLKDELAAKDRQINSLKAAMKALVG